MRVAILHYHLRPGGVTRVIEMASQALISRGFDPLVISGEAPGAGCRIESARIRVVPALRYGSRDFRSLLSGVEGACRDFWGTAADVLHTHNHALGKSPAFPQAVANWTAAGRPVVLQIHDFAENHRPANYHILRTELSPEVFHFGMYPTTGRTVLAFLTSGALGRVGADPERCALLPNPVSIPPIHEAVSPCELGADSFSIYPTRGIPRKNIGEFILHSTRAAGGEVFALTSRPVGKDDWRGYVEWESFCKELGLPVHFDVAARANRPVYDFFPGANRAFTTSREEGFGMAFLEPWVAGTPAVGRLLPEVTDDFADLDLRHFYVSLPVPPEIWQSVTTREALRERQCRIFQKYGVEPPDSGSEPDRPIDFCKLDPAEQREAIRMASLGMWSVPDTPGRNSLTRQLVQNAAAIRCHHSIDGYAERLALLYKKAASLDLQPKSAVPPQRVLDSFLQKRNHPTS